MEFTFLVLFATGTTQSYGVARKEYFRRFPRLLGRERADHSYHETKYTEIPHGMQVIETTRPGECWRARDARSGAPILETYCATIEQAQEVEFGGEPEKNNGTTPALPAKAPKLLDRAW